MNRKAMSPLVATVLLIAFAVALGAMIMNWSVGLATPNKHLGGERNPCEGVRLTLEEVKGVPVLCRTNNTLRFIVKNSGTKEIKGLQLRIITDSLKKINLEDSGLLIGDSYEGEVTVPNNANMHIEIVPRIESEGMPAYCVEGGISKDVIPVCS